jgi:hypothetical protein
MPACDEDAERTIARAETSRPTLDHKMVYVAGKNLKQCAFYRHELGGKSVKGVKPAHLNVMPACDEDAPRPVDQL